MWNRVHSGVLSLALPLLLALPAAPCPAQTPVDSLSVVEPVTVGGQPTTGMIDFTAHVMTVEGVGVPVPGQPAAQAERGAVRAALADARRNLVAAIQGVRVDAETIIRDHMQSSDVIRERVSGIVKGAVEVAHLRKRHADGSVTVTVALGIRNQLAGVVLPTKGFDPIDLPPPPPALPVTRSGSILVLPPSAALRAAPAVLEPVTYGTVTGEATGLIIDARGLNIRPAMAPRIVSASGAEIYGTKTVSRTWAIQMGMVTYGKDLTAARSDARVGENPLVLKASGASGLHNVDVVISDADAKQLAAADATGGFLAKCRVMYIVD